MLAIAITWAVRRSWAAGCGVITVFAVALGLAWLAGGQSFANLPAYVSTSIEMTRGYPQGMSLPSDTRSLGFAVAGLALAGLWLALRCFGPDRSLEKTLLAIVLAITLFLGFKASFVRSHDNSDFTLLLAASLFLLPDQIGAAPAGPRAPGTRSIRLLRWACVACGLLGLHSVAEVGWRALPIEARRAVALWSGALGALGDLRGFAEAQQRETENQARAFDLPRTRAVIGSHPVDLFGIDQLMLLRNGFAYRPRPVFQTYAAYTPALMELNAQHLEGKLAPSFVMMRSVRSISTLRRWRMGSGCRRYCAITARSSPSGVYGSGSASRSTRGARRNSDPSRSSAPCGWASGSISAAWSRRATSSSSTFVRIVRVSCAISSFGQHPSFWR